MSDESVTPVGQCSLICLPVPEWGWEATAFTIPLTALPDRKHVHYACEWDNSSYDPSETQRVREKEIE